MSTLNRKLDDLKLASPAGAPPRADRTTHRRPLQKVIGGAEETCGKGCFWRVVVEFERIAQNDGARARDTRNAGRAKLPLSQARQEPRPPALEGRFAIAPGDLVDIDPARTLVLDIETGGFSGTPVFLIGVVALDSRPLCVEQWLARDYPEEEAILRRLADWSTERTTWVTFNGKSFDAPFVLERARIHGVRLTPPAVHIDLLHAARRRWGGELPDCRLTTLESHILGRTRVGDVPGCDVPDLFHHFIRTRNAAPLKPVLEHNQLDLVTSTDLLMRLAGGEDP